MPSFLNRVPPFMWALGLIAISVVGANLYLAYRANSEERDLVREDYYEAGLVHDRTVNAERKVTTDSLKIDWTLKGDEWHTLVKAPDFKGYSDLQKRITRCEAYLYRPSHHQWDRTLPLIALPDSIPMTMAWRVTVPSLLPGYWHVTFRWMAGDSLILEKSYNHHVAG